MKESEVPENGIRKKIKPEIKFTILAIILLALFSFALTPVSLQNDTFYTIKIGEHINQYGVDGKDPFSWHEGIDYTYPHWLYDLVTYWIYSAFGMTGIYVITCLLSCALGISLYWVYQNRSKSPILSFLFAFGVMYMMKSYIAARAQLMTFILFIWTIFLIENFLEKKKIRYGIGLILISLLIANLHVAVWPFYFILYLPYLGEYMISVLGDFVFYRKWQMAILRLYSKWTKNEDKQQRLQIKLKEEESSISKIKIKREQERENPYKIQIVKQKATKWLILIFIIAAFMGLLTPLGDTPYTYLYKTMQGQTTQNINEHQPMVIYGEVVVICVIISLLSVLTFTKSKIRLSDLFMIGGLCYLMLQSRRQITMFMMIGAIVAIRLLLNLFTSYHVKLDKLLKVMVKPIAMIFLFSAVVIISIYFGKPKMNDEYISTTSYPVAACDFILEEVDLGKARFYNEYNYGSYLIYRGIPVFIDSRADLYDPKFSGLENNIFMDFINTSNISTFYGDVFEKYDITHVITYKNSKMNMIITKTNDLSLTQIYGDDHFVIYERVENE